MKDFNQLGLSEKTLSAVSRLGYEVPTPVQEQAIPQVIDGRDLIAAAKTGTGKTAAFALPAMDRLGRVKEGQGPRMLVVTPTRELAQQIGAVCEAIAISTHHRILTVVGGLSYEPQISRLKHGTDVLIATPGRLIDLMDQQAAHLNNVEVLVLDEADRMLDMGFWPSMKKIVAATPSKRQTLLFSATIDRSIMNSVGTLLNNPALVEIAHKGDTADTVDQYIVQVPQALKPDLLKAVLAERGSKRVIVFTRTRSRADSTCRRLKRAGYSAEAIHSDRSQNQRRRALDNFASGKTDVIVATDVLARGIDVEEVDYVVNFDLPTQPEDYVHRIGRTGRAGANGYSISFVSPETEDALRDIEKLIKRKIPTMEIKSFDVQAAAAEAAARATRANARKDPELAQAARELARKERKRSQAKEETSQSEGGGKKSNQANAAKKSSSNGTPHKSTSKNNQSRVKASSGKHSGHKGSLAQSGSPSSRSHSGQDSKQQPSGKPKGNRPKQNASQNSPSKQSSSPNRSGSDFRPGRAHRAALAKQRRSR